MKGLIIILSIISFLNSDIENELGNFDIRVFNDSNFKIEKYEIEIDGITTQFSNIAPHSYSQSKKIIHFEKFTFFNITVSKKRFLQKDFLTSKIKFPIDITCNFSGGSDKFINGRYLIKLKIKKAKYNFAEVRTEYIKE